MPLSEYETLVRNFFRKGILTSNIFYKDDENFMVRLGSRGNMKGDDRSLKRYSTSDINKMVHLRGLEKAVLDEQRKNILVYFQSETEKLEESIRGYNMKIVMLDYSHVDEEHRSFRFVEDRPSVDYKIANEEFNVCNGGLGFGVSNSQRAVILKPL